MGVSDPRQAKKVRHNLVELLVVTICAAISGADTFIDVEVWGKAKLDWLRRYLRLEHGIPSHDRFCRVFAAIDANQFSAAFRRWVGAVLPVKDNQPKLAEPIRDFMTRRLFAATSDDYRALVLNFV